MITAKQILDTLKKDFAYAYSDPSLGWIVGASFPRKRREATSEERAALNDHYNSLHELRKAKCQSVPYIFL